MKKVLFLILFFVSLLSSAQKCSVKGLLYDKTTREPLPFASVQVDGTTIGANTDENGVFLIDGLEPGYVRLVAYFIGYKDGVSSEIRLSVAKQQYVEIGLLPEATSLDQVNVIASPFRKVVESPLSMRRIGIADIENSPGGNRDISVVVQNFPGVRPSTDYRNDIIVRGGGPAENIFILDGVEIPIINHFATQGASGGPTGIMNVDFIDEVNLYTGAFPSKYGNVMSSVMDIKMSKANREKMQYNVSLGASEASFSLNGPLSEKSSLIFSVRQSYLQFLFKALKLPFLPTFNDCQFKYDHKISNNLQFSIFGIGSLDKLRLNKDTVGFDEDRRAILDYLPENDQYSYSLGSVLKHTKNNRVRSFKLGSSLLGNSMTKYFNNDRSSQENKIMDYSSREYRGSLGFEEVIYIDDDKFNFGVDYKYESISGENFTKLFINSSVKELVYDKHFSLNTFALYSQYSGKLLNERFEYSCGLRFEYSDVNKKTKNVFNHISPRISFSYFLDENVSINGNTGIYYSLPELLSYSYNDNGVFKNLDLPYIKCIHWVGGLEYNPNKRTKMTLEYFNKQYSNYPLSVVDGVSLANIGSGYGVVGDEELLSSSKGLAQGIEFMTRYQASFGMNLLLAYTYVKSEFTNSEGKYIPSSWDNRHILTLTASQKFKKNWSVGTKWRYVGGSPYTPYDIEKTASVLAWNTRGAAFLDFARYNQLRKDDFHQLDVRVDKKFFFNGWSLDLYVDVQNIYGFTSKGQSIITRVLDENGNAVILNPNSPIEDQKYKLKEIENVSGSVFPTFGLVVEF